MSSAILYLAIIAIWACVLIPRWLKRGAVAPVTAPAVVESTEQVASPDIAEVSAAGTDEVPEAEPLPAEPLSAEESRRHMLTARRRLLMMLTGLEIAAIALAVTSLAAVWVVIPPTVMLAGYLLLLREAAKADAERARHEAEAAAHARERAAARARAARRRATPADGVSTAGVAAAAEALAARFAAAPVPADYEDAGRDFAPGLAGKYTTSNADADVADEDYYYDGYEAPRLRAVGD
ncbi:MAG TPA: hypothetical protein VMI73_02045 [Trebonia sp.]|nr:hypothetical protein [Trebonia sp.]